jgi:plastocyanin domain-containing protein
MKTNLCATLAIFTVLFAITPNALAAKSHDSMTPGNEPRFQRIEQPLGVKIGVTAGGIALIGLELWWFLSRSQSSK